MSVPTVKSRTKNSFLQQDNLSALQAKEKAQYIAFGPVIFKVALALRNMGALQLLADAGERGLSFDELVKKTGATPYGMRVLIDGGVQGGIVLKHEEVFILSKTGYFLLTDEMTTVNIDFINDVCYRGLDHLEAAVNNGKPEGLKEFGTWPTVYRALSQLPQQVQKSWFAFDHFYSDDVFDKVLPIIFNKQPKKIMDIGGNTGKFALQCINYSPAIDITIVDLPGQIGLAKANVSHDEKSSRINFHPADMLDGSSRLPQGYDAIWMSQFLDCFSEAEIVAILKKCSEVMDSSTLVYILEPLTDKQRFRASEFVVQLTSLYFTAIANGNSRMYSSTEMRDLVSQAGLETVEIITGLGICQSLIVCRKPA